MNRDRLRGLSIALGLLAVIGQLAVAFMGDAIGGFSAIVVVFAIDAIVAAAGVVLVWRWTIPGLLLMAVAGLGAVVALFWSTLLEIGVAAFLLGAVIAAFLYVREPMTARREDN